MQSSVPLSKRSKPPSHRTRSDPARPLAPAPGTDMSSGDGDEGGECSLVLSAMIHQYLQRADPQLAASYKEALGDQLPDLPSEMPRLTEMVADYLGDDHASEDSDSEKDEAAAGGGDKQHQQPRKHGPWSCGFPNCDYKTFHAGHLSRHLRLKGHEQSPGAKSDDPSGPKDINDNKASSSDTAFKFNFKLF